MTNEKARKSATDAALLGFAWLLASLALSLAIHFAPRERWLEFLPTLPFLPPILIFLFSRRFSEYRGRRKKSDSAAFFAFPLAFVTVGGSALLARLSSLAANAVGAPIGEFSTELGFFGAAIAHALLPALAEELFFRFVLTRALAPCGERQAILLSALLFALAHGNLFALPHTLLAGLALGLAAALTKSVWVSIAIHFANNLINVALFFGGGEPIVLLLPLAAAALLALLSLALWVRRGKPNPCLGGANVKASEIARSPIAILAGICLLICLINTIF